MDVGLIEQLKFLNCNKKINLFLIGIHPDYQNKGVHAIIFSEYHKTFSANGITEIRRTPELDDNEAINKISQSPPCVFLWLVETIHQTASAARV